MADYRKSVDIQDRLLERPLHETSFTASKVIIVVL